MENIDIYIDKIINDKSEKNITSIKKRYRNNEVYRCEVDEEIDKILAEQEEFFKSHLMVPQKDLNFIEKNKHLDIIRKKIKKEESQPEVIGTMYREERPAAAGVVSKNYSLDLFGLPQGSGGIICEQVSDGYEFRLKSTIAKKLTMIFFKGDEILSKTNITRIPDEVVPEEKIEGWTKIELVRSVNKAT